MDSKELRISRWRRPNDGRPTQSQVDDEKKFRISLKNRTSWKLRRETEDYLWKLTLFIRNTEPGIPNPPEPYIVHNLKLYRTKLIAMPLGMVYKCTTSFGCTPARSAIWLTQYASLTMEVCHSATDESRVLVIYTGKYAISWTRIIK